jgi:hypothetical protein
MRISRGFTLPAHGTVELLTGLAMMVVPAALAFATAGLLVSVTLGAILTGMAFTLTSARPASAQPASQVAHSGFDIAFVLVTALGALALALGGETRAVMFLAGVVVVLAVLGLSTRYSLAE